MLAGLVGIVARKDEDEVAGLCSEGFLHFLQHFLGIELVDGALHAAVFSHAGIDESFGTYLLALHKVCEFVNLLAGIACTALGADTADVCGIVEDCKVALSCKDVLEFHKFHAESHVGLVASETAHGFVPAQTEEGRFSKVHATKFLEEVLGHLLEDVDDVVLLYKTHLAVNLREFRLTVGAEIFIFSARSSLVIRFLPR